MSQNIKKTALALAVMAACALTAPAAFAVTVDNGNLTNPLPTLISNIDVGSATTTVNLQATNVNIQLSDGIIGRTTGFAVHIILSGTATFSAAPATVTVGAALSSGGGWTATLAGGVGTNEIVYSVQPSATANGVVSGTALAFAANDLQVTNVASLATVGMGVDATFKFVDPVTTNTILNPPLVQTMLKSASPLAYSVAPSSLLTKKIDVGSAVFASKTSYAPTGALNDATDNHYFEAGTPTVGVTSGVLDNTGAAFTWAAGDTLNLTVNGTFNAFAQSSATVSLVTAGTCASPTTAIAGTKTATSVTFSGVAYSSLNAGAGILCFTVPGTNAVVIDATPVATSAVVTRTATGKTSTGSGDGLPMKYNGPVAVVYTFNPATNTTQESFLRISNTGGTGGLVTITGKDDMGAAAAGAVSLTLAAGKSIQLTSSDLQNGNAAKGLTGALGAGTGKWILTVTGEISGMEVTNLNRNNNSGTVSNFGTPVDGAH